MLILPPGHADNVQTLRRLTAREKRLIGGMLAVVAALVVGVVISLATASPSSGHGCLHLTVAGPVGAEEIDQCGATARSTCGGARDASQFSSATRRQLEAACRKASLPVG